MLPLHAHAHRFDYVCPYVACDASCLLMCAPSGAKGEIHRNCHECMCMHVCVYACMHARWHERVSCSFHDQCHTRDIRAEIQLTAFFSFQLICIMCLAHTFVHACHMNTSPEHSYAIYINMNTRMHVSHIR
jgi:hypothetical protein